MRASTLRIAKGGLVALSLTACSRPSAPAHRAGAATPPCVARGPVKDACRAKPVALGVPLFSPDGAHFLIEPEAREGDQGLAFALWDVASLEQTATPTTELGGVGTASWSGDGRSFVVVANLHTGPAEAHLWDARRRAHVAEAGLACFEETEWAAGSSWVALGGCEMGVALLRTDGSTWHRPFEGSDGAASQMVRLVARSGDTRLVYLVQDGRFESWDVAALPAVRVRAKPIPRWSTVAIDRARGRFAVQPVERSTTGVLPGGPKPAPLEVYDLDTGTRLGALPLAEPAERIEWTAQGELLVQGTTARTLGDFRTGRSHALPLPAAPAPVAAEDTRAVVPSLDDTGDLRLRRADRSAPLTLRAFERDGRRVGVAFSDDGTWAGSAEAAACVAAPRLGPRTTTLLSDLLTR